MIRKTVPAGLAVLGILAVTLGSLWPFPFREREPSLRLPGVVEIQEIRLGSKVGGRRGAAHGFCREATHKAVAFEPGVGPIDSKPRPAGIAEAKERGVYRGRVL